MNDEELLRYSRHILLPGMDIDGQKALKRSRVMVIGAGGLGSPVAMYLAAAGVGTIDLVDPDTVELSNLQRQIAHTSDRLGYDKVESAALSMRALNPFCEINLHPLPATEAWLKEHLPSVDLLLDCTDNANIRYQINRACLATKTPWISGAAVGLSGQLVFFNPSDEHSPCYRCLYPDLDRDSESGAADGCAENGVLAPVVGVVGSLQAVEALKLLAGMEAPQVGRLQLFDFHVSQWRSLQLKPVVDCADCQ